MYSTLGEALIALHSTIGVCVIAVTIIIICFKKKELHVDVTQPSFGENSKIAVDNRVGETDIEMPSNKLSQSHTGGKKVSGKQDLKDEKKSDKENKEAEGAAKVGEQEQAPDAKKSDRENSKKASGEKEGDNVKENQEAAPVQA